MKAKFSLTISIIQKSLFYFCSSGDLANSILHLNKDGRQKGKYLSTKFGSYVEHRGSRVTWTVKERDYCPNFLQDIDAVRIWVNKIFKYMYPEIESRVSQLSTHMRLWDATSLRSLQKQLYRALLPQHVAASEVERHVPIEYS
jgi:hypothetical protein